MLTPARRRAFSALSALIVLVPLLCLMHCTAPAPAEQRSDIASYLCEIHQPRAATGAAFAGAAQTIAQTLTEIVLANTTGTVLLVLVPLAWLSQPRTAASQTSYFPPSPPPRRLAARWIRFDDR